MLYSADKIKKDIDSMVALYEARIDTLKKKVSSLESGETVAKLKSVLDGIGSALCLCDDAMVEIGELLKNKRMDTITFKWESLPGLGQVLLVYEENKEIWSSIKYI